MRELSRRKKAMNACIKEMAKKYGAKKGLPYIGESGDMYEFYGDIYVNLWDMYHELNYEPFRKLLIGYFGQFARKHGIVFDKWVNSIVKFDKYYFSIEDIMYDLDSLAKRYLILQWQDDLLAYNEKRMQKDYKYVNFRSYCMGFRYSDLED